MYKLNKIFNNLKASLYAILIGNIISLFAGLVLGRIFFFIYGGIFFEHVFETIEFNVIVRFFSLGLVVSMYVKNYKWIHSLFAYFAEFGMFILLWPLLSKFLSNEKYLPDNEILKEIVGLDSIFEILIIKAQSIPYHLLFVCLGTITAYLFNWHRKNRPNYKSNLPIFLKPFGYLFCGMGIIGYSVPFLFFIVTGIPYIIYKPLIIFVIILSFLLTKSQNNIIMALGTFVLTFLFFEIHLTTSSMPPLFFIFLSSIVLIGTSKLYKIGRRILSITTKVNRNPDILLLRSFKDDFKTFYKLTWIEKVKNLFKLSETSFISIMSNWFKNGKLKFVAVSDPKVDLPMWISGFIHAPYDWIKFVENVILKSKCIIMIMGTTSSLVREFCLINETKNLHKLILIVPPGFKYSDWQVFWQRAKNFGYTKTEPIYENDIFIINFDENNHVETKNYGPVHFLDLNNVKGQILESVIRNISPQNERLNNEAPPSPKWS